LLGVSPLVAPSSGAPRQLSNTVFFAAILGLVALGQHLVVVSGGIDLSVAPTMTLTALLFASFGNETGSGTASAAGIAILVAMLVGVANGLAVTYLRITPLVATLAVGAIAGVSPSPFMGRVCRRPCRHS
jgi:ribose transport system permease protein